MHRGSRKYQRGTDGQTTEKSILAGKATLIAMKKRVGTKRKEKGKGEDE